MAIVTPADRPKSVRNRCVIEVFGGVLCVVTLLFGFFCRCKGFCHRAESDLFLFSYVGLKKLTKYFSIPKRKTDGKIRAPARGHLKCEKYSLYHSLLLVRILPNFMIITFF